jgi:hypothetical protein
MDIRVALAFIIFSVSLNLLGAWAGIGEFDRSVDINEVRNDLDFDLPEFTSDSDDSTWEALQTAVSGFAGVFNQGADLISGIIGILKLAIPTVTGVAWFDLLVWLPMSFGVLLGIANWLRGK